MADGVRAPHDDGERVDVVDLPNGYLGSESAELGDGFLAPDVRPDLRRALPESTDRRSANEPRCSRHHHRHEESNRARVDRNRAVARCCCKRMQMLDFGSAMDEGTMLA